MNDLGGKEVSALGSELAISTGEADSIVGEQEGNQRTRNQHEFNYLGGRGLSRQIITILT